MHLLAKFLQTPAIDFLPPLVTPSNSAQPHTFKINVVPFLPRPGPYTVTLTLTAPGQAPRVFSALPDGPISVSAGGSVAYKVAVVPVPPRTGPKQLHLTTDADAGSLVATVPDQAVRIAGRVLQLSQILRITQTDNGQATVDLITGSHVTGHLTGLSAVSATVAGMPQVLNFSRYPAISIEEADAPPTSLDYQVSVKRGTEEVGKQSGTFYLGGIAPVTQSVPVGTSVDVALPLPS